MKYNHPDSFRTNTRVLIKTRRKKDNQESKNCSQSFVSRNKEEFNELLDILYSSLEEGYRIYSTACYRNVKQASRIFRERQLEADYSDNPMKFYEKLQGNWASALASPKAEEKSDRLWMFDCDCDEDVNLVKYELSNRDVKVEYSYYTKLGGQHLFTKPFNRNELFTEYLLHKNPTMLWAYK